MKRLMLGLLASTILIGCGRQNFTSFLPDTGTSIVQNDTGNQVSIQSEQGVKQFYSLLVAQVFNFADQNYDKNISYDEFKALDFYVGNGSIGTIIDVPAYPSPIPTATPIAYPTPIPSASSPAAPAPLKNTGTAKDTFQTFLKIDKNKDGRITLAEAQASYYFLGVNQAQLRVGLPQFIFNQADMNKDKSVSKEEYVQYISIFDPSTQPGLMSLFFASDKNFDNRLSFSEFEDLVYASVKSGWEQYPDPGQSSVPCTPSTCTGPVPVPPTAVPTSMPCQNCR